MKSNIKRVNALRSLSFLGGSCGRSSRTLIGKRSGFGCIRVPLTNMALVFAPTNEAGVLLLFGMLAEKLGFIVTQVQSAFPDCHALLKLDDNTCQLMRIEFEFESRNFLEHGHPVKGCDMIVCWIHNWKECPLQVVELKPIVMELLSGRGEK